MDKLLDDLYTRYFIGNDNIPYLSVPGFREAERDLAVLETAIKDALGNEFLCRLQNTRGALEDLQQYTLFETGFKFGGRLALALSCE